MPVVTVPFVMALLGFRSTEKSVLLGMAAGITTVLIWDYLLKITVVNSVSVGMFAYLIILISSHYLLKQSGGWVGIKDKNTLVCIRAQRKESFQKIIRDIKSFNILKVCKNNYHNGEGIISVLGLFVMIVTFSSVHNLSTQLHNNYSFLLDILYPITLCTSSSLISYPLWLQRWKDSELISVIWNFIMFSVLICFSFFIVLISNFSEIQLIVFMVNIIVIVSLIKWKWALFNIILGVILTTILYNNYIDQDLINYDQTSSQFKFIYLVLLTTSSFVLFLKPKQELQEKTERKSDYLSNKLDDQKIELKKSLELKQEFLRNLEHEARTPITSISTMGSILDESYDKLSEKQRRKAIKDIAKSSERLNSLISNILDLSKLSGLNYQLNITDIDFSELVYERVKICRKLYTEDKYKDLQEVTLDISDNIIVSCDKNYITTAIDNTVINALQYCTDGKITIILHQNKQEEVVFKVKDEGIGIPKEELYDVFGSFTVSSKTKTPAGGRGVGLALSKKVVDLHNGRIWAKQNSDKGITVGFNLPLKN
jgi:K+-sensing histidine kinase KdpD